MIGRCIVHTGELTFPAGIFKPLPAESFPRFARPNAARADIQMRPIPDSTAGPWNRPTADPPASTGGAPPHSACISSPRSAPALPCSRCWRPCASTGRPCSPGSASRSSSTRIDGPMARRLDVVRLQPNWSGDVLDLVVDFVTYVFVPAYAITASGLLLPLAAPLLGIGVVVSRCALFRRPAHEDATTTISAAFRRCGTPRRSISSCCIWPPALSSARHRALIVATFLPFYVLHPVRVARLRWLTLTLMAVWARARDLRAGARFRRRNARHGRALRDRRSMSSAATVCSGC